MLNSSKLRRDGRLANELRAFQVNWDPMEFALSSLIISTGKTSVLCSISIENDVPNWRSGSGKGWLTAEYRLLPGSTPQRKKREFMKLSGRTQEIQRLIGRSLRAVVDFSLLGEKTLLVDCDVIQADAGTRTAAITGSWIAMARAFERLISQGLITVNPLIGQVAGVSVGLTDGNCFLDLDYLEDSSADVDMNVVMSADHRFLELQGTAERASFSRAELNIMLDFAEPALEKLHLAQKLALEQQN